VASEGSFPWEDEVELAPDARAWVTVTLLDQPEERSTWTWVAGGAGAALLLGALVTGVATLVLRDQLLTMRDQGPGARARADISLESFANEVDALAATTDVLLGAGAVSVGVGLILFFATDPALAPRSTATVNRSTR